MKTFHIQKPDEAIKEALIDFHTHRMGGNDKACFPLPDFQSGTA